MERGDIYFVSLDPTAGHEQQGQRPVVVITPGDFNSLTGVPIVLPITSGGNFARVHGFAVSLSGTGMSMQGVVRCDQPRAIDLRARKARRARERVPDAVMMDILARVTPLFG
jgi:mRNA-degrading endonuclease toxin of MazEF toxin-antitoxin module